MKKSKTLVFLFLIFQLHLAVIAQSMIPIPPAGSTFGLTRGYWFTSPTDFTIVGVRVPTDVTGAYQSAQILLLPSPPPSYSANTNTFTSLGYWQNVNSTTVISTAIPIYTGNVIMVLGARSTSNSTATCTNTNSYGPYTGTYYPSSVCGSSMNLTRAGFQDNICRAGAYNVWQEPSTNYYISRVEVWYSCMILPADLLSFKGEVFASSILLDWHTESESNLSHFEVERAVEPAKAPVIEHTPVLTMGSDGVQVEQNNFVNVDEWQAKEFVSIGKLMSRGGLATAADYTFKDEEPISGLSYYRLKKVDLNGSSTYSNVIEMSYNLEESHIEGLWPNPSQGQTNLNIISTVDQQGLLSIFDVTGKQVRTAQYKLAKGLNIMELDMADQASGAYFVKLLLSEGKTLQTTMAISK